MNTFETISGRFSYRGAYQNAPVPREHLKMILQAGLDAPSGCNKQTTSFIAIDDPALMETLFGVISRGLGKTAPAMICVLTQRIIAYRDRTYYIQDYSAAIQNMLLAIEDLGYASCWVEGHITDVDRIGDKMAKILNVPDGYELICYLPVGIAAEACKLPVKKPYADRISFNGFGK